MAVVKPFPAIRPQAVKAAQIAALPYDVFTRKEAVKEIEKHPLSFLRVDRPETNFPEGTDMYSPQVYEKAGELLWRLVDTGDLCQDLEPCYYIYELSMGEHVQTGVAACASVDDYVILRPVTLRQDRFFWRTARIRNFADFWISGNGAIPIITFRERTEYVTGSGLSMKEM